MAPDESFQRRCRRSRRQAGLSLLWCLASSALLGATLLCLATLDPDIALPVGALAILVAVSGIGLVIAARRDFYDTCLRAGLLGLCAAAACAAVAALTEGPSLSASLAGVTLGSCAAACLLAAWREAHGEDPLRNVLLEEFKASKIFEIDGVQFTVSQSDTELLAGEELNVKLLAQNGFDCERGFVVQLHPRPDVGRAGHLSVDKELRVELPAGAAAALCFPIVVQPQAKGSYSVRVEPRVTGAGGTRVRRWRARRYQPPVSLLEQVLASLLGGFAWGGGLNVEFRVRRGDVRTRAERPEAEVSSATAKLVYQPEQALVRGFALTR